MLGFLFNLLHNSLSFSAFCHAMNKNLSHKTYLFIVQKYTIGHYVLFLI